MADPDFDVDDATAQDVLDAMRFVVSTQRARRSGGARPWSRDDRELLAVLKALVDFGPETESDRGISLVLRMVVEGTLRVEVAQ